MSTALIFPPTQNAIQKTLGAQLLVGATASATLSDVTGIQNKKGIMVVDRVDTNGNATASLREYITFTGVSGSTVTGLTRGLAGSTDQTHAVGAVVEFVQDALVIQAIIDGLLQLIDTTGTLDTTKIVDLTTPQTLTNKVLTSPTLSGTPTLDATSSIPFYNDSLSRQALINAGGDDPSNTVVQSGRFVGACNTWSNHTNYYGVDGWLIYSSDTTQMASDGDVGGIRAYRWNTSTATNKVAIMQIIEAANSYQLRGNVLSFGFVPTFLGGVNDKEDLTVFVLAMEASGTADSITNAPITSFGASGTRPTFDTTNYTVLYQADVSKSLVDGVYRVTGTTITVPSDTKNIIFGVVNKDGFYNGGDVYAGFKINRCVLNIGSTPLPFMPKSFSEELLACQRLYEKSYNLGVAPGTVTNTGSRSLWITNAWWFSAGDIPYRVIKRTTPTITIYNTNNGTSGQYTEVNTASTFVANRSTQTYSTMDGGFTQPAGVGTVGNIGIFQWVADCRL